MGTLVVPISFCAAGTREAEASGHAIARRPCRQNPLGYHVRMPFPARRFHRFMPMRF
jgi:hypothetical protein